MTHITTQPSGAELPVGTVTLLFTDIEASTRLIERHGPRAQEALAHRARLEAASGNVERAKADARDALAEFSAMHAEPDRVQAERFLHDANG